VTKCWLTGSSQVDVSQTAFSDAQCNDKEKLEE